MHPQALILLVIGLVLVGMSSAYALAAPAKWDGEALGRQRKAMLVVSVVGACCLAAFAAIFLMALADLKTPT
ncbi:hypothetical protein [Arthrobacter sp. NPDC089319]|uniref:hypothetical protein n=1 Tax=Arthrobacter sp. NPDC089319 TaxID=3155915 RepID=UPI00343FF8E1